MREYSGTSRNKKPKHPITNSIYLETDTERVYKYDGASWVLVLFVGLSTDIEPDFSYFNKKYFETDTNRTYIYDGTNWKLCYESKEFDVTDRPVRAQGTADGVQYGSELGTVQADTNYELLLYKSFGRFLKVKGPLVWVEYNIEFQLKAGSETADLKWRLQARDKDGIWVDMCVEQTADNIGTSYVDKKIAGYLDIKTNITKAPFEMRLIFQSNESAPGIAIGRIKNTTFIRMVGGG